MEAGDAGGAASAPCQCGARMFMICLFIFIYSSKLHQGFIGVARPKNFVKQTRQVQSQTMGERIPEEFYALPKRVMERP